ncbi:helix-turn-helix domain-containing protein [Daejeonella lutea]|uniref:Helix-turn-helix n=1 Tax=Daejeonella lutea TaxID=572036 RepID=A0A1T5CXS0_9SPHI|nr:helix-turn-helix domain-containing protein [Daejeonella lutea]SKB64153.1 Helix-turn-helix [Daejeonella lutea]
MEKKKSLGDYLREKREELDLDQFDMGRFLGITQPAYSKIESGKVRFTPKLLGEIKSIKNFEHFDAIDQNQTAEPSSTQTLSNRWRWGKFWLYLMVFLVGAFCLDMVFQIGVDFYRGFTQTEVNKDTTALIAVIYFAIGVPTIWWLVFKKKW